MSTLSEEWADFTTKDAEEMSRMSRTLSKIKAAAAAGERERIFIFRNTNFEITKKLARNLRDRGFNVSVDACLGGINIFQQRMKVEW